MKIKNWWRRQYRRAPGVQHWLSGLHARLLESRTVPSVFVVSTTADSGAGGLRAAVQSTNFTPGADQINFNLPTCAHRTSDD